MGKQSDGWCRKLVVKRTTGGIKAPCAAKQRFQNKTGSGAVSVFVVSGFQKPLRRSVASGSFSRWFPPTASAQTAEAESWRTQVHTHKLTKCIYSSRKSSSDRIIRSVRMMMITAVTVMKVCSFCPGVELLLSEVYDSAFSGLRSGHSFSQTNIYRVLQRRMLGVRLALTGHFRCKII